MEEQTNPRVVLRTTLGDITLELDRAKAPVTTENFLSYVSSGHFNGTVFHRVIPGVHDPRRRVHRGHEAEADGSPHHQRGRQRPQERPREPSPWPAPPSPTARAASSSSTSRTTTFSTTPPRHPQGWGYAVFGKVVDGMDVVDTIAQVKTGAHGPHRDVPADADRDHRGFRRGVAKTGAVRTRGSTNTARRRRCRGPGRGRFAVAFALLAPSPLTARLRPGRAHTHRPSRRRATSRRLRASPPRRRSSWTWTPGPSSTPGTPTSSWRWRRPPR